MIKNIVFDFGGVIAPISRDKAVEAFVRLGLADADSRLDKYHQTGIFQELEEGRINDKVFQEKLGELCGRKLEWEETQNAWLGFFTTVNEEILTYLEELRSSYKLYVLSNTNPYVMGWACSEHFSKTGKPLSQYVEKLYLSYEIGYTKPDERIYRFLLNDASLNPAETLFVDDGYANAKAGEKLGMHVFVPENGEDWREKLKNVLKTLA